MMKTKERKIGGQVCSWRFSNCFSICWARCLSFRSLTIRSCILKYAVLTDEYFSKPTISPISVNLYPPSFRHWYIAMAHASFASPRLFTPICTIVFNGVRLALLLFLPSHPERKRDESFVSNFLSLYQKNKRHRWPEALPRCPTL